MYTYPCVCVCNICKDVKLQHVDWWIPLFIQLPWNVKWLIVRCLRSCQILNVSQGPVPPKLFHNGGGGG